VGRSLVGLKLPVRHAGPEARKNHFNPIVGHEGPDEQPPSALDLLPHRSVGRPVCPVWHSKDLPLIPAVWDTGDRQQASIQTDPDLYQQMGKMTQPFRRSSQQAKEVLGEPRDPAQTRSRMRRRSHGSSLHQARPHNSICSRNSTDESTWSYIIWLDQHSAVSRTTQHTRTD
jgi:hypothetical protein